MLKIIQTITILLCFLLPVHSYGVNHTITGTTQDIQTDLRARIDTVGAGEDLRVSIYIFTNAATRTTLLDALARGVRLVVVTEVKRYDAVLYPTNKNRIDDLIENGATVHFCQESCHGTALNHDKVVITNDWAYVTSANFSNGTKLEQAFVFNKSEAPLVHEFLVQRFNRMAAGEAVAGYDEAYQNGIGAINAGPADHNFYLRWFNNMAFEPGCFMKVVMGHMDDILDVQDIITRLRELQHDGCTIEVIYSDDCHTNIFTLAEAAATATESPIDIEHQSNVHSKYIIWQGLYHGMSMKITWTGTVNMTDNAMFENDEVFIRSLDIDDFNAHNTFFGTIDASEAGAGC